MSKEYRANLPRQDQRRRERCEADKADSLLGFIFARSLYIESVVSPLNLFKVFPRFGAMILGQPTEQTTYSLATHFIGCTYDFSSGVTFGVIYVAMIGDATSPESFRARRHWAWAVLMAVGLELAMPFTPYPRVFGINALATPSGQRLTGAN